MRSLTISRHNLARIAVVGVSVFAVAAMTLAGGEVIRITSPANGQQVKGLVRVEARTPVEDAAYVIFCVDGDRPHSTNVQPYVYQLDTTGLADGPHVLAAELYGRTGLAGQSASIVVRVANGATVPQYLDVAKRAPAGSAPLSGSTSAPVSEPRLATAASGQRTAPLIMLTPTPPAPVAQASAQPAEPAPTPSAVPESPVLHVSTDRAMPERLAVVLDGSAVAFDVTPTLSDGRSFAALRTLMEQSGGAVAWLAAARQAIAKRAGRELQLTIGATQAKLDNRAIELGFAPQLTDGRTVVPLRATCEPLGFRVAWSDETRTVYVRSGEAPVRVGMLVAK